MDAAEDLGAGQGLLAGVLAAQAHQGGHFRFGDDDFATTPGGQGDVGDLEIVESGRREDSAH
ncbi:hypothetical protein Q3H58_003770 [Pseudomonas psychrotolerans]|nr:hypothetical protein [Pseudomonas psychrotolerans]